MMRSEPCCPCSTVSTSSLAPDLRSASSASRAACARFGWHSRRSRPMNLGGARVEAGARPESHRVGLVGDAQADRHGPQHELELLVRESSRRVRHGCPPLIRLPAAGLAARSSSAIVSRGAIGGLAERSPGPRHFRRRRIAGPSRDGRNHSCPAERRSAGGRRELHLVRPYEGVLGLIVDDTCPITELICGSDRLAHGLGLRKLTSIEPLPDAGGNIAVAPDDRYYGRKARRLMIQAGLAVLLSFAAATDRQDSVKTGFARAQVPSSAAQHRLLPTCSFAKGLPKTFPAGLERLRRNTKSL